MVVNDLDILGAIRSPCKTYAPLVIDANAVLTLAFATQRLQTIARRRAQEPKRLGGIQPLSST